MHFERSRAAHAAGLAALFISLPTLAQPRVPVQDGPRWETFASLDDRPRAAVPQNGARLLFLRPVSKDDAGAPADIMVDGRFHTALLPGGFSEVDVCPGPTPLELAGQGTTGLAHRPRYTVQARPGETTYVVVQAPDTAAPLKTEPNAELARERLRLLSRQTHARSRVAQARDCPPIQAPAIPIPAAAPSLLAEAKPLPEPVAPAPLELPRPASATARYTLSAEALFRFGGSRPQHLSEQGQTQIVRLARRIKENLRPSQVVLVQGHTDPTGSAALNRNLSVERARTVSRILINSGLPAQQVRAEGVGSSQLLVKDCDKLAKSRDDRLGCNRPNRRVEITVSPSKN